MISGKGTLFEFILTPVLEITTFDNPFLVNIWDYDTTSDDDFMTSFGFFGYASDNNFPEIITVVSQSDELLIDLKVSYQW